MKTARLRSLIRKYGDVGVVLVACYLLLYALWQRRRALLAAGAALGTLALMLIARYPRSVPFSSPEHLVTETEYTVIDLGTPPNCVYSVPLHINAAGQVVGFAPTRKDDRRAFLWQEGKMRDLGTLGGSHSLGTGINSRGEVVGTALTRNDDLYAFAFQDGKMKPLGAPPGTDDSAATSVNDNGQVAGVAGHG